MIISTILQPENKTSSAARTIWSPKSNPGSMVLINLTAAPLLRRKDLHHKIRVSVVRCLSLQLRRPRLPLRHHPSPRLSSPQASARRTADARVPRRPRNILHPHLLESGLDERAAHRGTVIVVDSGVWRLVIATVVDLQPTDVASEVTVLTVIVVFWTVDALTAQRGPVASLR